MFLHREEFKKEMYQFFIPFKLLLRNCKEDLKNCEIFLYNFRICRRYFAIKQAATQQFHIIASLRTPFEVIENIFPVDFDQIDILFSLRLLHKAKVKININ